jgi:hypothetical protein
MTNPLKENYLQKEKCQVSGFCELFFFLNSVLFQLILVKCHRRKQCCGSGSGIGCFFDPWVRDP